MSDTTIRVTCDVVGLPEVMALAHAARDAVDSTCRDADRKGEDITQEIAALRDALKPILPGAVTDAD